MQHTIMLVDDERDNLHLIAQLLSTMGYAIKPFISPLDALAYLSQNDDIDLLILDVQMPQMSGCEFHTKMLQEDRLASIPTLFYTGYTEEELTELCGGKSINILDKPLNVAQLKEWLAKLL